MDTIDHDKLGKRWFFGAGLAALIFAVFLACMDHKLSTSTREIELNKTMREIRSAQHSMPAGQVDQRITAAEENINSEGRH